MMSDLEKNPKANELEEELEGVSGGVGKMRPQVCNFCCGSGKDATGAKCGFCEGTGIRK